MSRQIKLAGLTVALLLGVAPIGAALAQTPPPQTTQTAGQVSLYATTASNKLIAFNSASPGTVAGSVQITGIQSGEQVVGIDFRPATGQLFALGSGSRLYTIDTATGAATSVGTVLTTTLTGTSFGFDFNPLVDRIRVVSNEEQDLRLNPNNGALAAIDGSLVYSTTDANTGKNPNIIASAYSNNVPGPAATTLYNIDSSLNILVKQVPPNNGVLNTVGPLGVDAGDVGGFDIIGGEAGYAALQVGGVSNLYMINIGTGAATLVGPIGGGEAINGLTGALAAAPATVTPAPATPTESGATGTPSSATATPSGQATAAPATTVPATAVPATSVPATAVPATAAPATAVPTQVVTQPTSVPATVAPTPVAPGMPSTGGSDKALYMAAIIAGLGLLATGLLARRAQNKPRA